MTAVHRAEPFLPRCFGTDKGVRRIVRGLLARGLSRAEWTHEAHLAAVSALVIEHPGFDLARELPRVIASYNVAVGGVNDDQQGYHETLTLFWIGVARRFHARTSGTLVERVNQLILADPEGRRDYPLRFWSAERLFSVAARRRWVEPDRMRFEDDGHARPGA